MSRIIKKEFHNCQYTGAGDDECNIISKHKLNSVSLNWINIIKSQTNKNTPFSLKNYKYTVANKENTAVALPFQPIGILSSDILQIYKINSIDDLLENIDTNIKIENILTINRILNCWIYNNYSILKQHNDILEKIYKKIIYGYIKYFNIDIEWIIEKKNININKEIKEYIDYWINKNNNTQFSLNLLTDFINYFIKKYKL